MLDRLAGPSRGRIVEELALLRGQIRIDIALISSRLQGFEIKSELDSLVRLPRQRAVYSKVFDRVTLVAAERHIKAAQRSTPRWWGIWVVRRRDAHVEVEELRPALENPAVDVMARVQLLWRDEAVALLQAHGITGAARRTRRELCEQIVGHIPADRVRPAVTRALRCRQDWRLD